MAILDTLFAGMPGLERTLDFHIARHNVLASNLSNAETPGYVPKDIAFSDALASASDLSATDSKHLSGGLESAASLTLHEDAVGNDGNGVNLEREMTKLAVNRIRYETGVELVRRRLGMLRYAATDGQG